LRFWMSASICSAVRFGNSSCCCSSELPSSAPLRPARSLLLFTATTLS
jgi:hypothetical protein